MPREKLTDEQKKFKLWYEANGDDYNDHRKNRYKQDPEYRARVQEGNKKSRLAKKLAELPAKRAEAQAIKFRTARSWKEADGEAIGLGDQKLMTIGALAQTLGRCKLGVRLLERKGLIPKTELRNEQGERLYTPEMVLQIVQVLEEQGRLRPRRFAEMPKSMLAKLQLSDESVVLAPVFRVGVLAVAVSRSTITLEQLERKRILPVTPFRAQRNRRVYTAEQIEAVKNAFDRRLGVLRGEKAEGALYTEIMNDWATAKVVGAQLLALVNVLSEEGDMDDGDDDGEEQGGGAESSGESA